MCGMGSHTQMLSNIIHSLSPKTHIKKSLQDHLPFSESRI